MHEENISPDVTDFSSIISQIRCSKCLENRILGANKLKSLCKSATTVNDVEGAPEVCTAIIQERQQTP